MLRKRLTSLVLVSGPVYLILLTACALPIGADSGSGWMAGAPSISFAGALDASAVQRIDPTACTNMSIPVVRNIAQALITNTEQHCMVRVSEGLVDAQGTVYQPNGFTKAYPVTNELAGHPLLVPTPNYPGALSIKSDGSFPGVDLGLYKDLSRHLVFNGDVLHPAFSLTAPDMFFTYPTGRLLAVDAQHSLAFSADGTYLTVEAMYYGFVRINLTTLQMTTFAGNSPLNSGRQPLGAATAVSPSARYAAIAYNAPGSWGDKFFKLVDVDSCDAASLSSSSIAGCQTMSYWPQLQQAIPGLNAISNVQFASDSSLNFVATIQDSTGAHYARYELTAAGQTARLEQYLALGDSYASGEGTFDYTDGTDTALNKCHLSALSYPFLVSARIGVTQSVACSGAVVDNVLGNDGHHEDNQLKGVDDPNIGQPQKDQAYSTHTPGVNIQDGFVVKDDPQIVTISIGGNDVGFADIIARCILPFSPQFDGSELAGASIDQDCYGSYEDRLELVNTVNAQFDNLVETYRQLMQGDPTRRVYVIGYPQIIEPDGNCGLNVRLSQRETEFAGEFIGYLDTVIQRAAAKAGVVYVDTQHALDGHRLCEAPAGQAAVNGLTAGTDRDIFFGDESYHPTQLGHQLLTDTILAATHNLTDPMPAPDSTLAAPAADDSLPILQAAKSGRPVNTVLDAQGFTTVMTAGAQPALNIKTFAGSLMPDALFQATLHSDPVDVGTVRIDAAGILSGQLAIPADMPTGIHTLHLYGKNVFGDPVDIQQTVYIAAAAGDYDGDGLPNDQDACPYVPASGVDIDADGIDDACDPQITGPPVTITQTTGPTDAQPSGGSSGRSVKSAVPAASQDPPQVLQAAVSPQSASGQQTVRLEAATVAAPASGQVLGAAIQPAPAVPVQHAAWPVAAWRLLWAGLAGLTVLGLLAAAVWRRQRG